MFGAWLRLYLNSPLSIDDHASWRKTSMANIKIQICANRRQTGVWFGGSYSTEAFVNAGHCWPQLFLMCVSELRTKGCCCLGGAPRDSYQKSCSEASWQTSFQTIQVCYAQMWMLHAARNPWSNHPTNSNIKILRKLSSIGKHGSVQ